MGVVSSRWMWVESMGVVVRRYIDYLILLIPTPLVSSFLQQHPYFLFIFYGFFSFNNCMYILSRIFAVFVVSNNLFV